MEDILRAKELKVMALDVPATSKVAPGDAVWIPTLLLVLTMKAGVALDKVWVVLLLKSLAETPVSITKFPVVWKRTLSEDDEPLKTKNSWVPAPVLISAKTVLL